MLPVGSTRATALAVLTSQTRGEQFGPASARTSTVPLVQVTGFSRVAIVQGLEPADLVQKKLQLYEQAGRELGVDMAQFSSLSDYAAALKRLIGEIKMKPGGEQALVAVSTRLGLDKLGISLDTLVGSIFDPEDRKRLDAALVGAEDALRQTTVRLSVDDTGAYRPIV